MWWVYSLLDRLHVCKVLIKHKSEISRLFNFLKNCKLPDVKQIHGLFVWQAVRMGAEETRSMQYRGGTARPGECLGADSKR